MPFAQGTATVPAPLPWTCVLAKGGVQTYLRRRGSSLLRAACDSSNSVINGADIVKSWDYQHILQDAKSEYQRTMIIYQSFAEHNEPASQLLGVVGDGGWTSRNRQDALGLAKETALGFLASCLSRRSDASHCYTIVVPVNPITSRRKLLRPPEPIMPTIHKF